MALMNTLTVGANTWQIPVTSVNGQTGDITVTSPSPSSATPADLGTAAVGTATKYAREDHIHNKPTYSASDVGAIALPASPSLGDFLVYNGSAWAAVTMAEWQGGSY